MSVGEEVTSGGEWVSFSFECVLEDGWELMCCSYWVLEDEGRGVA